MCITLTQDSLWSNAKLHFLRPFSIVYCSDRNCRIQPEVATWIIVLCSRDVLTEHFNIRIYHSQLLQCFILLWRLLFICVQFLCVQSILFSSLHCTCRSYFSGVLHFDIFEWCFNWLGYSLAYLRFGWIIPLLTLGILKKCR